MVQQGVAVVGRGPFRHLIGHLGREEHRRLLAPLQRQATGERGDGHDERLVHCPSHHLPIAIDASTRVKRRVQGAPTGAEDEHRKERGVATASRRGHGHASPALPFPPKKTPAQVESSGIGHQPEPRVRCGHPGRLGLVPLPPDMALASVHECGGRLGEPGRDPSLQEFVLAQGANKRIITHEQVQVALGVFPPREHGPHAPVPPAPTAARHIHVIEHLEKKGKGSPRGRPGRCS
mmetsp:Transcript_29307/g.65616  ORF Transcript_29307/g.65616 Transcript_29307/m.65616 type:complete len:235 (+) Transcript_29307:1562-2266(+)